VTAKPLQTDADWRANAAPLLAIEGTLRAVAKRLETYRLEKDRESEELDAIFEAILGQADAVRMLVQPTVVGRS